jgi:hypothetical protein
MKLCRSDTCVLKKAYVLLREVQYIFEKYRSTMIDSFARQSNIAYSTTYGSCSRSGVVRRNRDCCISPTYVSVLCDHHSRRSQSVKYIYPKKVHVSSAKVHHVSTPKVHVSTRKVHVVSTNYKSTCMCLNETTCMLNKRNLRIRFP